MGGCPFSDWVRWEAKLVREVSEEGGLAENLVMAGSFLTKQVDKQGAMPFHACRAKLSVGDG